MERTIKAGARQYEAFAGKVVYMHDYEAPEYELDAPCYKFRWRGFDLLPIDNFIIQTGKPASENPVFKEKLGDLVVYQNEKQYGCACGALAIPDIILYNEDKKCYYGLQFFGDAEQPSSGGITRYDENGRYLSRRYIKFDKSGCINEELTTCNKELYDFVNIMTDTFRNSDAYKLKKLRNQCKEISDKITRELDSQFDSEFDF